MPIVVGVLMVGSERRVQASRRLIFYRLQPVISRSAKRILLRAIVACNPSKVTVIPASGMLVIGQARYSSLIGHTKQ